MYQIYFDNYLLYDPRAEELIIRKPDVHLAVGEAGRVNFVIDPDHPYADRLTKLKGSVRLVSDGVTIYRGRIRKDTRDFNLSREIETEGLLACLFDSVIPPFDFPADWQDDAQYQAAAESGNVVDFFLGWLLAQHNSQVSTEQQILLGEVTVSDPNNYISRASSEYSTTMDVVRKKLEDTLGGYLLADYTGEVPVLNYYDTLPLVNVQEVVYGENLLDLVLETDAAETYTAILPTGAEGLTLADLPDGEISPGYFKEGRIIYSEATEDMYDGVRIVRHKEWKDVTLANNLQMRALMTLQTEGIKQKQTISVKVVDLDGAEGHDAIQAFHVGQHVKLNSTPHGISVQYPLMELDIDIFEPWNTEICLRNTALYSTNLSNKE